MYGNMEMLQARICDLLLLGDELTLQACTEQELSAQTFNGETCLGRISLSFTPLDCRVMFMILLGLHGMLSGTEHRGVELTGTGESLAR